MIETTPIPTVPVIETLPTEWRRPGLGEPPLNARQEAWRGYCKAFGILQALRSQRHHCPQEALLKALEGADRAYDHWKATARKPLTPLPPLRGDK